MSAFESFDAWVRRRRALLVVGTLPLLLFITWVDGQRVAQFFAHGQHVATAVTILYWVILWRASSNRLGALMIVGLVAATAGEAFFSLALGMYEYRLARIPVYVPPGHTILYAAVFIGVRLPSIHRRARVLSPLLFAVGGIYSVARWALVSDTFGLICFGIFVAMVLAVRGSRLFFAAMYLLVVYLELLGTQFGAWVWPEILLGRFASITSANPPSGVAVFYCAFDLVCLALYFAVRFTSFERWVGRLTRARSQIAR